MCVVTTVLKIQRQLSVKMTFIIAFCENKMKNSVEYNY